MSNALPSISDLSALSNDERAIITSLRELQTMSGVDAARTDVETHISGITSLVASLTRMAITISKEDPKKFTELSTIVQYLGAMLWEWQLRKENNTEMLQKLNELGRSSAEIGHGLFPLDDPTHPVNTNSLSSS